MLSSISVQSNQQISSKEIGHVLRILGQNPTEDEIIEMVMKVTTSCPPGCSPSSRLTVSGTAS